MTAAMHQSSDQPSRPVVSASGGRRRPEGVRVDGVAFDRLSEAGTVDYLIQELHAGRGGWVITSNLDHLSRARRDPAFRGMLDEADLVVADGAPLVWASRLQGTPLPERVAGSAMAWSLTQAAAEAGKSVFLLGGDLGIAEKAAEALQERFPSLAIAGLFYPPMGFEKDEKQMQAMRAALAKANPDLVYVALGSPKQELLIQKLRSELPQAWWLGLGISLSFICGEVQRAPVWMQKMGLEWVHRMIQEPRRLARRYLIDGIPFGLRLVSSAVIKRCFGGKKALIRDERAVVAGVENADERAFGSENTGRESEQRREKDGREAWGV